MTAASITKNLAPWLLLLLGACSGGSDFGSVSGGTKDEPKEEKQPDEDEEADVPAIVAGAYLTCAETAGSSADELEYGCGLDAKNGKRINLSKIASEWHWRATPPADASGKKTVAVQEADDPNARNQATLKFSGAPKAELQSFADATRLDLQMDFREAVGGIKGYNSDVKRAVAAGTAGKPLGTSAASQSSPSGGDEGQLTVPKPPPSTGTGGVEPGKPPPDQQPPPIGPDRDNDGVPNEKDLCNATPAGVTVWKEGEWIGCAGDEYKDADDTDLDRVPNSKDKCGNTPAGATVDTTDGGTTMGCADGDTLTN